MRTYYITGIAGFLGNNLLNLLKKNSEIEIIGFVLPHEKDIAFLQDERITLVEGNILEENDVRKFLSTPNKGEKYLIHMAGRISTFKSHDKLTIDINYNGTKNIVDMMNKVGGFKKIIYVSSVDALPKNKGDNAIKEVGYFEIDKVDGAYSKSKVLASNYVLEHSSITSCVVLPSALLGPNDPNSSPINNAIKKFLNDKLPAITKGGYNLVDARDVAQGIIGAIEKGKNKQSYILAGHYISVKDLIALTAEVSNKKPVILCIPHFIIKIISPFISLFARIKSKTPLFTDFHWIV